MYRGKSRGEEVEIGALQKVRSWARVSAPGRSAFPPQEVEQPPEMIIMYTVRSLVPIAFSFGRDFWYSTVAGAVIRPRWQSLGL
ncbi:hypothetical protein N7539_005115 [Penicillium diatomitis]|uniref:Uncharacterized protein n=1 Tax=Penicillium diatomitis TaxID=2819901 RepID=A0A9W9X6C9_9EURO|nr:uncharacterized protein N7539_005115 [Penicillium diatomitis]KAJ5485127.1 hypothetical protein N7539_005115 [Penicillium diatomitis]